MSIEAQISRLQALRNTLRTKLVALGLYRAPPIGGLRDEG